MKRWAVLVLLLPLLCLPGYGTEIQQIQEESAQLDGLQQAAGEYGQEFDLAEGIDFGEGLNTLKERAQESLLSIVKETVGSCVMILMVVLLCSLVQDGFAAAGGDKLSITCLAGVLGITAIAMSDTSALVGMGQRTIGEIDAFSDALLPVVAMLTATSGSPASAAAGQLATMLFSDVLILVIDRLLLPLVYAYVAVCAAGAATGNEGLKRIAGLIKWVTTSLLTLLLLAFVTYLTVSGAIAGSTDAMTVKTAKLAISGVVPVVGGILADAAETVLAGAGILKNTVGIFGMLVVLGMCIVPFLQLGVHYIAYRVTGALAGTVGDRQLTGLIEQIGSAFGLVLGMTGACAFLLLISMISAVSLVVK